MSTKKRQIEPSLAACLKCPKWGKTPGHPAASSGARRNSSPTGRPITLETSPSIPATSAEPSPCTAYPPALPFHSPLARYESISLGASSPKVTRLNYAPAGARAPHRHGLARSARALRAPHGSGRRRCCQPACLSLESGLAQGAAVNHHLGVSGDHQRALSPPGGDRARLGECVGEDELLRRPLGRLLDLCQGSS